MPATPDLAPGARQRTWILLTLTAVAGTATFLVFGHTEILWITTVMLLILLYLLLGVRWSRGRDLRDLQPAIDAALAELSNRHWLLLDNLGTVLHITQAGAEKLGHAARILTGQRFGDLVPEHPQELRVAYYELLRFGAAAEPYEASLTIIAEDGSRRVFRVRTLPLQDSTARRAALIALVGD